jgi:hypothetical protein
MADLCWRREKLLKPGLRFEQILKPRFLFEKMKEDFLIAC